MAGVSHDQPTRADKLASRSGTPAAKSHRQRRREQYQHGADRTAKGTVNQTKTRLRSVQRLLKNKTQSMPPDQRISLEREQATLQDHLQGSLEQARKKRLVSKYHMVRFFERRKAERALKRACKSIKQKDVATDGPLTEANEVHCREVDLNYTMYFPLSQAYVSLYPKDQSSTMGPNRSSPVWKEVESAMEEGTLQNLRSRPSTATSMSRSFERRAGHFGGLTPIRQARSERFGHERSETLGIAEGRATHPHTRSSRLIEDRGDDDGAGFFE